MNSVFALFLILGAVLSGFAQESDSCQLDLRLNPVIESAPDSSSFAEYDFIDASANKVRLNGADWSKLVRKYKAALAGDSLFTVVYLGDSHIQADMGGAVLRRKLSASRPAGRGLVVPFKLAGTNQPRDYRFHTAGPYVSSKLLKMPWATDMPFTGIGIKPVERSHSFTIGSDMPFNRVRLLYRGGDVSSTDERIALRDSIGSGYRSLSFTLDDMCNELDLRLDGDKDLVYAGAELLSDTVGVLVHSIGNNGACYSSYGFLEGFGRGLSALSPDLVIIALGTNEAFGRSTSGDIRTAIESLTSSISHHNPDARMLLVSPAECYKKVYRRKRKRRRRTASTVVNAKVLTVRNVVADFAVDSGLAFYDHYAVAGGDGAAALLKKNGLLSRDGVHYTGTGYRLWGALLGDAVVEALSAPTADE